MTIVVPGFDITGRIYASHRTLVYRALRVSDRQPVVLKLPRRDRPTFQELVYFRNQYAIGKRLHSRYTIEMFDLLAHDRSCVLVMEDWGGISLAQFTRSQPLAIAPFLAIALQLADALHDLGQARVIHKDLKPANILIRPDTQDIKLIDFSLASLLPRETQELRNPAALEGTLAYLSPEQTGRMNRGIDYRSDFYSLGVTFYELLAGQLPFPTDDPLVLVHSHLARTPAPVHTLRPEVPVTLSEIVARLMAKNAEDRYQSALGLKHDLLCCQQQWQSTGAIAPFPLAQQDRCDRFLIPERLYGRDREVRLLLDAFERVAAGGTELLLVAGYAGVGKTAVISEVHKPIVRQRGYFIRGKFDQFQRNIPFSAFVQALRGLMGQLLSESDAQIQRWRDRILAAVGENGQAIADVIPEVEALIGKQPPLPELPPSAAQNRFHLVFQRFVQVFASVERPLTLFLDDLQWADSASLALLSLLLTDASHLLILGAYRDNEVSPTHPLLRAVRALESAGATVGALTLAPLSRESLDRLVADTLACTVELAQPLAELVYRKTQGNPFFATQFLTAMHRDGAIAFDAQAGCWQCDLTAIRTAALTDDVVAFMAQRLQKLPPATQTALQIAACIGNQFALHTLAIAAARPPLEVATALWEALQAGMVLPGSEVYKFFGSGETDRGAVYADEETISAHITYRFLHDRIQQAAYDTIATADKQATHLRIGQLLLQQTPAAQREETLFAIVNQCNLGMARLVDRVQRDELAHLNLQAARKARLSAAYEAAARYGDLGLQCLDEGGWQRLPDVTWGLHLEAATAACAIGDFDRSDRLVDAMLSHTTSLPDRARATEIRIQAAIARNQLADAIAIARSLLHQLGVDLPETPTPEDTPAALADVQQRLAAIDDVAALPPMDDPEKLAAMTILSTMASAAYIGAPVLYPLVVLKQIELSVTYGHAPETAYAFSTYGLILCAFGGDIAGGNRAADVALALLPQFHATRFKAKIFNLVYPFVRVWREPLRNTLAPMLAGYEAGLESGDLEFAAYCAFNHCQTAFFAGVNLLELHQTMQDYDRAIAHLKQGTARNFHQIGYQAVCNWLGRSDDPTRLIGSIYDETVRLPQHEAAGESYSIGLVRAHHLMLAYHLGDLAMAREAAKRGETAIASVTGTIVFGTFYFYRALTGLAALAEAEAAEQASLRADVAADLAKLEGWAHHAPTTYAHKVDLIRAEQSRLEGDKAAAIDLYDRAIAGARAHQFVAEEALACERAAAFYAAWGKMRLATEYLADAYYAYSRWGAAAKIAQLERHYPHLLAPPLPPEAPPSATSSGKTTDSTGKSLDFQSILAASRALSQEIRFDRLFPRLIEITIAIAGADRAVLFLHTDGVLERAIEYACDAVQALESLPLEACQHVPIGTIHYVARTLETAIAGTAVHPALANDPDYLDRQPQSVLCMPILHQSQLVAVLYLENATTRDAFSLDRVEILNPICAQIAISLENARLFHTAQQAMQALERQKAQYRGIFEAVTEGLAITDLATGKLLEANPAYCQLHGYSPDAIVQIDPRDKIAPEKHGKFAAFLAAVRAGETTICEASCKRSDGTPFEIELISVPFQFNGRPCGLSVVRDVTERKRMASSLQEKNERLELALAELQRANNQLAEYSQTLEARVEERTVVLQELVDQKDRLMKEIHHRVKNSLQLVLSLLSMQMRQAQSEETVGALSSIRSRTFSIALIHDKLYRTNHLSYVAMDAYLRELVEAVFHACNGENRIHYQLELDSLSFHVEIAQPCGLIVNELLINSFKHAFPHGRTGTVGVSLRRQPDGAIALAVWDNGMGTLEPSALERSDSLGMNIVRGLVRQLRGTLDIQHQGGTRFQITFPAVE